MHRFEDIVRQQADHLAELASKNGGRVPADEYENFARLRSIADARHQLANSRAARKWPLLTIICAALCGTTLLAWLRFYETEIEGDLSVSDLQFEVGTDPLKSVTLVPSIVLRRLRINRFATVALPRQDGASLVVGGITDRSELELDSGTAAKALPAITLDAIRVPYGTAVTLASFPHGVVIQLEPPAKNPIDVGLTVTGHHTFRTSAASEDSRGELNRKVAVYQVHSGPAGVVLRLFLSDSLAFAEDIPARRFRFNSNLYDAEGAQIYPRTLSAVISGNLYLEALNGKTLRLRTREDVAFAGSSGEIRTLRVERAPDKPLSIRFHAVVSGAETGSQSHPHSIMPSYLEWLSVRHNLLLMWGSFAYVVAVASAVLKWLKWERV